MRIPLAILALLLAVPHAALALTPLDAGGMQARVLITNTVEFVAQGPRPQVSDATATLTWFPREDALQGVRSITTTPDAQRSADAFTFNWTGPDTREDIALTSLIQTRNAVVPVTRRIPFPLRDIPPDVQPYLAQGEIADQSPDIQRLAQQLAAGKDDEYEVVYALADWTTTNVQYSLMSLRAPAIQTASQVLESRKGKCDELTALFISMNRALGIPVRFVAGYSYTNSNLLKEEWGGHGWAEVWMPGTGWVPFDVTYGEYGYLDAGHVKLKVSQDVKETSIDYAARGSSFSLSTQPLDIYVTPLNLSPINAPSLDISLEAPYSRVGFGSAVLILATVRNTQDHYVSTRLDLAQTTNTEMLSGTYKNILLRPHEARTLAFLARIDSGLDGGYRYGFPFRLSSRLGEQGQITIDVEQDAPVYAAREFDELVRKYTDARLGTAPFSVTCERDTEYEGATLEHACAVEGAVGDTLDVCDDAHECRTIPLEGKRFSLNVTGAGPGIHTGVYTATALGQTATFFAIGHVVEPARVDVALAYPAAMVPEDQSVVEVRLNGTGSTVSNLSVTIESAHAASPAQHIDSLDPREPIRFTLPGRALRPGDNPFTVRVMYQDELGTHGNASAQGSIALTDVSLVDRLSFWASDAGEWLGRMF